MSEHGIDLIIGGTSGLGLELAREFADMNEQVVVTGRHNPNVNFADYKEFELTKPSLSHRVGEFVMALPPVKRLIYAAGFFQEGRITELSEEQIEDMLHVGGAGLIYFTAKILQKQDHLDELITITSTSQWVPRQYEPVYNYTKAGAAHYTRAMAEDGRIDKVMVAGPSSMRTDFWDGVDRDDLDQMLDPKDVAEAIMKKREEDYGFTEIRILRNPFRVEEVETR